MIAMPVNNASNRNSNITSNGTSSAYPAYRIASIPADGIGPEVISAGIEVLQKLGDTLGTFAFDFEHIEWGSKYYQEHGHYIPDGGLERLKKFDAILLAQSGHPTCQTTSRSGA